MECRVSSSTNTKPQLVSIRSSWDCVAQQNLYDALFTFASDAPLEKIPEVCEKPVVLEQSPNTDEKKPCVLYIECLPHGSERILCLEIVSEARTMEMYADQEYCGTSRGESMDSPKINSANENVTLYKTRLCLQCPATCCEAKLLSIGGEKKVAVNRILLELTTVVAKPSGGLPSLGTNIDLERVQTIMESMGSKLSPGAQHLMNMVQFQQKNRVALGGLLQGVLGTSELSGFGDRHAAAGLAQSSTNASRKTDSTSESASQSSNIHHDLGFQTDTTNVSPVRGLHYLEQNIGFPGNDLKGIVSSLLDSQPKEHQTVLSSDMLPFLQNLCSQVSQLRVTDKTYSSKSNVLSEDEKFTDLSEHEKFTDFRKEPQICSYMEKMISEHLEQMEQRLTDYIDLRINKLQEHFDARVLSLVDLLQRSPVEIVKGSNDFNNKLTNGEL